ncbi:MAG: hypothetical protein M1294_12945 [Firmicutes bacterium]|uniref:Uncharacterized protein n=1 Tax=Sulfobacillus benefaciens TaxID=453960 RepID=A0A2T2WZS1_9FIRM|nr:hypothetical protein [Bacillota bacterium]PSR27733.1 MAG: hypothetical protein C7B43_11035 [Sulfobacillus benefaciens]HBQ94176.1 hypothetical protein [Sulfobacillus sp.]
MNEENAKAERGAFTGSPPLYWIKNLVRMISCGVSGIDALGNSGSVPPSGTSSLPQAWHHLLGMTMDGILNK